MIAQKRIEELAGEMLHQYRESEPPFIVFLGKACLRAATAQYTEQMKQSFMRAARTGENSAVVKFLGSPLNWNDLLEQGLKTIPPNNRGSLRRLALSVYRRIPIPSFYQDLAVMTRQGYFREILTTNYDTLLEQALEATGMRRGVEYHVINLQNPDRPAISDASGVLLFKLHGDLGEQEFDLNPGSLDHALQMVRPELRRDLLVVGYEGEAESINPWFCTSGAGAVWWIAENTDPVEKILEEIGASRELHVLNGRYASPEWFFQHLFQLVVKSQLETPPALDDEADDAQAPIAVPPLDQKTALRNEIEKAKNVLANLQQGQATALASADLEAQLEYQKQWIEKMERELMQLESPAAAPAVVVDEILKNLPSAQQDRVQATFQQQLQVLLNEWTKPEPNKQVVNAMLGTAIVLGEQFGERLLQSQHLQQLKALAGQTE